MRINLASLREMHPRLPPDLAFVMAGRAALGLQRNGHRSPSVIHLVLEYLSVPGQLAWPEVDLAQLDQHEAQRITEEGAEAVALAVAHLYRGWRVVRRMQREERADWLLESAGDGLPQTIALEVSGVDHGGITGRLAEKLGQVALSRDVDQRWAGVVGFERPEAALRSTEATNP